MRRVHRAFSAITPDALSAAFRALDAQTPCQMLCSRSVDARQELDLRVGVAMTRLHVARWAPLAATLRPRPN